MLPYVTILGRTIPTYGLMGIVGILLGLLLAVLRCRRFRVSGDDCAYLYAFAAVGMVIGAKLLYLLPRLPQLIADLPLLRTDTSLFFARYLSGGMVFYGGLIGCVLGALGAARLFRVRFLDFVPVLVPVIPLVHAFGRVGCFCAGCCYGIPAQPPLGVAFTHAVAGPNGVSLLPVQLWEAAAELVIFLFLLWYSRRSPRGTLRAYLLAYAPVRFVLEFFRGDAARGVYGPFSTSQWIGLAALAAAVLWLLLERRTNAHKTDEYARKSEYDE